MDTRSALELEETMKAKVYLTIVVVAVLAVMGACVSQDESPSGVTQTGHIVWSEHVEGATIYGVEVRPFGGAECIVAVADYSLDYPNTVAVSCR